MSKFTQGQLVTCVMYEGVFMVSNIHVHRSRGDVLYRYSILRGEEHYDCIPGIWLLPARILKPRLRIVGGTHTSVDLFPSIPYQGYEMEDEVC